MDVIKEKIRVMTEKLNELKIVGTEKLRLYHTDYVDYKTDNTPPGADVEWKEISENTMFSGYDAHFWVHTSFTTPEAKSDFTEVRLQVLTGKEGQWDATNPQFTVFVNGSTSQALDTNHTWIALEHGKTYDVYMYVYTGMINGVSHLCANSKFFSVSACLDIVDLKTESLYYDINVPYLCLNELESESYDYIIVRNALSKACMLLDLREFYSDDYYRSVDATAGYLKNEFYGKICGKSDTVVSCIGHTHIDVAWLWTVAQTREKAQRSFSTVINLMDRYDDYVFMSSQAQLYQHVKESDPELYGKIKERISEGRWEVEGAMWLEADTNLSGGESLIRQVLHGKRFMKEEFGVESNILWLPDVFGYSGALPQILKKSGVDQFFTAKMCWNDVNKMPDDTFIWEGIDGSKVFTSMIDGYVKSLDPDSVYRTWKNYKNKDYSSTNLLTFGYGDGGGGPTAEMMENHRRLKHGIPGMPRTVVEKGGEFFNRIEEEFIKNAEEIKYTPKWVGEMYFERHRGTLTSIAKNKKNNRKSEFAQLKAESTALADMLLSGNSYPAEELHKNQINILLNQFHDILPGSSIKEVYDVCDNEYAAIMESNGNIARNALESIVKLLKTDGGIFVYNPTSFEVSDFVDVDGKTYYAQNVPAHGWKVVEMKEASRGVTVSEKCIENDVVRVSFNDAYHIVSVYDKSEGREAVAPGAEANVLEVFEDYPHNYDAWEINSYYKHKKWIADDVSEVTLLTDGIRVKRKYMKSLITQDIKLRKGSKRIDFVTNIDWNEDHVLLKAAFPVDIHAMSATYDIQFGNLERPVVANNSWDREKFEVCAHKWADLSECGYGVSILNDCKYGYSIEENVMKLSLLKAATYPNPCADREIHDFTYSLYPHTGDFRCGSTVKEAYLLNAPLDAFVVPASDGALSDVWSFATSDSDNVIVEAIKKAEDDNSVIMRVYESYNKKSHAVINTGFDFKEAYICDMLENNIQKLSSNGRCVEFDIANYEIVTLKFIV